MDLSLKYSKTSKGAKAVLSKSRALPSQCLQVLSNIDGKTTASAIQAKLQFKEEKFTQAVAQLLDEAYIQVVHDFGPTVFDLNAAIEVSEISTEEFLKLELPEEQDPKTQEQLEAEARARAYAEEQARKEAQAREQQEAERKLLIVTDILAKSGHKIDIEKLAEPGPSTAKPTPVSTPSTAQAQPQKPADKITIRLDVTTATGIASEQDVEKASTENAAPVTADLTPNPAASKAQEVAAQEQELAEQRKIAEAAAKREAEIRAKAEAERKAQEEAERRAREKAEEEARERETVERKAKEKAELEARLAAEAEAKAREKARKAEEKARKEEERRLRKEEEAARKRAEQQAREEEKARARAEAERKAKEETERRAREKAEAEARARELAERKAADKAKQDAIRAAEAQAKAEAARLAEEKARLHSETLAIEKAAAREVTKHEAQAKATARAEAWSHYRVAAWSAGAAISKKLAGIMRPLAIGSAVIVVALLLMLQFVSLSLWSEPVEQMMANSIGEPVQIRDLKASLWPRPHLVMENVAVGPLADITARSVHIYPDILTLWSPVKTLKVVEAEGLSIEQSALQRPLAWVKTTHKQQKYRWENISLTNISIKLPELELPAFDAEVALTENGALETATLTAKNISADIKPANDYLTVNIAAQDWQMPLGSPLTFSDLNAKGIVRQGKLELNQIEGLLYGGTMKGRLTLDWLQEWNVHGNFELANINLGQATSDVSESAHLQGRVYATGDITASAHRPEALLSNPTIQARFEAEQGEIGGLDLARAASGREQVSGNTRYDQLSGTWTMKDRHYQIRQLALKAGSLTAQGDIAISPEQELSGRLQTRLDLSSRQLQGRFNLSGKLGSARISR